MDQALYLIIPCVVGIFGLVGYILWNCRQMFTLKAAKYGVFAAFHVVKMCAICVAVLCVLMTVFGYFKLFFLAFIVAGATAWISERFKL
jgi:hypothetical protein